MSISSTDLKILRSHHNALLTGMSHITKKIIIFKYNTLFEHELVGSTIKET
jgi:hypothetical protein